MSTTINAELNLNDLPAGCGCSLCMETSASTFSNNDPVNDGGVFAPSVTATPGQFADYLTDGFWTDRGSIGRQWNTDSDNIITYSLSNGYTDAQKAGLRMAFDSWEDVADITFSEVSSGGNINMVVGGDGRAYSSSSVYLGSGDIASSTISIDTSASYWQNFNELGDYALTTAIHEIGHSLGLGHTGNYNGSATYATNAQFVNDSRQYSVMSYFDAFNTGSNHQGEYAATPLLFDILAIQNIYGADYTTRAGDTVYGFNSTAGSDAFDFTVNIRPVVAIWDGGGTDTIDVSGWSSSSVINLNAGEFSNVGGGTGNLVIAIGAVIENAVGGSGVDIVYGNDADNIILGNAGNDIFYASMGDDTINGGANSDTIIYNYNFADLNVSIINYATLSFESITDGFTDLIGNVETYQFNDVTYTFAEIYNFLTVDTVSYSISGTNETGAWGKKLYSTLRNSVNFDATDLNYAGTDNYFNVNRSDNDTLSLTSLDTKADIAYVGNKYLTSLTLTDFNTTLVEMNNAAGVSITLNNSQTGTVNTGAGDDTVTLNAAYSDVGLGSLHILSTAAGNDTITLTGNDALLTTTIYAGSGNDTITASGVSTVKVFAGAGDDTITGGDGADLIYGQYGTNTLHGGGGDDTIYGGTGNDTIYGDIGGDRLEGRDGDDIIEGGVGNDYINGGNGNDILRGGDGFDQLIGKAGVDYLYGGADGDVIYAGSEDDFLYGETGDDFLVGEAGNDRLEGGAGYDQLYGQDGNDILIGGTEADLMAGGYGDDILVGNGSYNSMYGNAGADTFGFSSIDIMYDRYMDFNLGEGDAINITDVIGGYTDGVDDINDFVYFNDRGSFTDMYVSANGDGNYVRAAQIFDSSSLDGFSVDDLVLSGNLIANAAII